MRQRYFISVASFIVLSIVCCQAGPREGAEIAIVVAGKNDPTLAYAVGELRELLALAGVPAARADFRFDLRIDPTLPPASFAVISQPSTGGSGTTVSLLGKDSACVLHAVYTALERAGICFDSAGPAISPTFDLERLRNISLRITPAVRRRGIRQHLNFPMDISSYPLTEAKEYIRNLARMRMNCIVFHSYPGQWHSYSSSAGESLAGNFFYGQRHDIPDHPTIKSAIRNRKTFCIPEIEPLYDNPRERDRAAKAWLGALVDQAKLAGMTVNFSIEVREKKLEDGMNAARAVLETYPKIDGLELITEEFGNPGGGNISVEEAGKRIAESFGEDASRDPSVTAVMGKVNNQFLEAVDELGRNIAIVRALKEEPRFQGRTWRVGVYAADRRTLRITLALMRRAVPDGVEYSFMPGYGSRYVAQSVAAMNLSPEDLRRTMVYSWVEYDGNLYLQQNSIEGMRRLIAVEKEKLGGEVIAGICFNHWRTAENRTSLRYAALASVEGAIDPEGFYREYGAELGIGRIESYVEAMKLLDEIDMRGGNELSGIGFCYSGSWVNRPGMAWIRHWGRESVRKAREDYLRAERLFEACAEATSSEAEKAYLRFLANRVRCSAIHLEAIDQLLPLTSFCDDKAPEKLTAEQRLEVLERCRSAEQKVEEYIQCHARAIVDRGCEGTLISYHAVMSIFIGKIKSSFGGLKEGGKPSDRSADAPPAPGGK